MVSTTKKTAAVNRVTEALENSNRERMRRHSPEQKLALIDVILKEAYTSDEPLKNILTRHGVNCSAFARWISETRA